RVPPRDTWSSALRRRLGEFAPMPGKAGFDGRANQRPFLAVRVPLPSVHYRPVAAAPALCEPLGNTESEAGRPDSSDDRPRTAGLSCTLLSIGRVWPITSPKCWAAITLAYRTSFPSDEPGPGDGPVPKPGQDSRS